eukprot:gene20107-14671_t
MEALGNNGTTEAITICRVSTRDELLMIRELQEANLGKNISAEDRDKEGFVTAEYSVEFLELMDQYSHSIIAKNGEGVVIGYALVATRDIYGHHDLLTNLFDEVFPLSYHGKTLRDTNFVLVGQLCVAVGYRGLGLVQRMYAFYQSELKAEGYECAVTDVAESNPRSLKAHKKSGFDTLATFTYEDAVWHIVCLDF